VSKSLLDFAVEARSFGRDLGKATRDANLKVAQGMKATALANTREAAPALRLNRGRRGARIGVRYNENRDGRFVVMATGPYQLIESDTVAHVEPKQRGARSGSRFRTRKTLLIPGIGYRKVVKHPGTRGKHPWRKSVDTYGPKAQAVWRGVLSSAVARKFGIK
jgi:hypothetical protein